MVELHKHFVTRLGKPRPFRVQRRPTPDTSPEDVHELVQMMQDHKANPGWQDVRLTSRSTLPGFFCLLRPSGRKDEPELGQPVDILDRRGRIQVRLPDNSLVSATTDMYEIIIKKNLTNDDWQLIAKYMGLRFVDFHLVREGVSYVRT